MFEDILKNARDGGSGAASPKSDSEDMLNDRVRIAVVGVGGGGTNTIHRINSMGIKSAKTIAINTDALHLKMINSDKKVLIGKGVTRGLGAGGFPEVGMKCAEADKSLIMDALGENELVFITAGMGGGTGTGGAPVVAKAAKQQGAVVVSVVTYPFKLERARIKKAQWGLQELMKYSDTLIVIDNNRLVSYAPNLPVNKAFMLADQITARAIKGISDTIIFPSLLNIDYADVKAVMTNGGLAMISVGDGTGADKVEKVVKSTLQHPLLDVDYEGAKGALIHIGSNTDLTLGEAIHIGDNLTSKFDDAAQVKLGARIGPEYGSNVYVTMITTGVKSSTLFGCGKAKEDDAEVASAMDMEDLMTI